MHPSKLQSWPKLMKQLRKCAYILLFPPYPPSNVVKTECYCGKFMCQSPSTVFKREIVTYLQKSNVVKTECYCGKFMCQTPSTVYKREIVTYLQKSNVVKTECYCGKLMCQSPSTVSKREIVTYLQKSNVVKTDCYCGNKNPMLLKLSAIVESSCARVPVLFLRDCDLPSKQH